MNQILSRPWLLPLVIAPLIIVFFLTPPNLRAHQRPAVADFAAPMSARDEQVIVRSAQTSEAQTRAAILRTDVTPPGNLPSVQTVFFAQTNHHLSNRAGFLEFWQAHGSVFVFGYPISEETVEDGRVVQYFERARFEYHPEQPDAAHRVQLSLLGNQLTAGRVFEPGAPENGEMYFPETGHTLSGKFKNFWLKRGGLRVFGFPISEPLEEVSPVDGQTYMVQYFERARFEYHASAMPEFYRWHEQAYGLQLAALHEIQLGDLGRQAAQQKGLSVSESRQLVGAPVWSPMIWQRRIEVNISTQHLTAYEGNLQVYSAPVATGKDGFNTPVGTFAIYSKTPMQTMIGSGGGETWNVPNIPWVQYIVGGVAFHGTYWHDLWGSGVRMSHGCINLNIDDAQWLYEWADIGTEVVIHY
jgi:hypothetical protein